MLFSSKGCRKNQKSIQSDLYDIWFHSKCINTGSAKFNQLSDSSMAWRCMKCLFPGLFDTPPMKTYATSTRSTNPITIVGACLKDKFSEREMKCAMLILELHRFIMPKLKYCLRKQHSMFFVRPNRGWIVL